MFLFSSHCSAGLNLIIKAIHIPRSHLDICIPHNHIQFTCAGNIKVLTVNITGNINKNTDNQ